jgi:lipoprotein-anchoring transpeptidase ErfK/SrfK
VSRVRGLTRRLAYILILPLVTAGVLVGIHSLDRGSGRSGNTVIQHEASNAAARSSCRRSNALIGTVAGAMVQARAAPTRHSPVLASFARTNVEGNQQVFLLVGQAIAQGRTWFRALLPVRPNGTMGFIPGSSLTLAKTPYRLTVSKEQRRLTLWNGCRRMRTYPVGIGTKDTPTPVGTFYLASLLKPPVSDSVYGVYAYGLSGYSPVIHNWKWGGVIGLHGTNEPSSVGHYTSHGCIRMYNRDIEQLVRILPLGTPITIS